MTPAQIDAIIIAARRLLARIDHITTIDFAYGGERIEREHLRRVLAEALGIDPDAVAEIKP